MRFLVLIPAYNEEKKIGPIIKEIINNNWEVVVIDDASSDDTINVSLASGARVLSHFINRGQGAALKTGIEYALSKGYESVVFFDADGQMMVSEIKKFANLLSTGEFDVILGSRFIGRVENIPFAKEIVLKMALVFSRLLTGLKLTDVHNGFQGWNRSGLEKISLIQDRQAYASEILNEIAGKKLKYKEIPVTIKYTDYSKGKGQSIFNAVNILWDLIIKK